MANFVASEKKERWWRDERGGNEKKEQFGKKTLAENGKEFPPAPPDRDAARSFFTLIDCISFYFYSASTPLRSFPHIPPPPTVSFTLFGFLLPFITCHPTLCPPPPSPSVFPSYSRAKRDNGTPCCVICVCVWLCRRSFILCFVLAGWWCHAYVWQNNQQTQRWAQNTHTLLLHTLACTHTHIMLIVVGTY